MNTFCPGCQQYVEVIELYRTKTTITYKCLLCKFTFTVWKREVR